MNLLKFDIKTIIVNISRFKDVFKEHLGSFLNICAIGETESAWKLKRCRRRKKKNSNVIAEVKETFPVFTSSCHQVKRKRIMTRLSH